MSRNSRMLSPWQELCLAQLRASAARSNGALSLCGAPSRDDDTGTLTARFTLDTSEIDCRAGGLPLADTEDFLLSIDRDDDRPPAVYVDHFRFLGHPHVLSGFMFCLYLDESREWEPAEALNGSNGVLNRLWRFLVKAAAEDFDATEALYHAVGGLPHLTSEKLPLAPIVVRDLPEPHGSVASAWLVARSPWCYNLEPALPTHPPAAEPDQLPEHVPVFYPERDLPFGAGNNYLSELTHRVALAYPVLPFALRRPAVPEILGLRAVVLASPRSCGRRGCPLPRFTTTRQGEHPLRENPAVVMLAALAASAARKPAASPQLLVLAVPHPMGGPRHLIAVHFDPALGDRLRALAARRRGALVGFDHAQLDASTPLRWCYVSDERPDVTRRRDVGRPVTAYLGKRVLVWGVGGLGSWIAEFVLRAGAKHVTVCDTGRVTGGLLVRQDYVDLDIGAGKAGRLEQRLRDIAPDAVIDSAVVLSDDELEALAMDADLIIDASVSRVVARRLDTIAALPGRRCVIAQVATDVRTGTLGLVVVAGPGTSTSLSVIDRRSGAAVADDPELEPYRIFWDEPQPGDEFVPTRGCSLPTFHGSAADLAAVAGTLTSLIATHLNDGASGTHVIALPHSGVAPAHHYRAA
jgi:hypothetical protein